MLRKLGAVAATAAVGVAVAVVPSQAASTKTVSVKNNSFSPATVSIKKGSKVARFILIGLGPASLEGKIKVVDAANATLLDAPFDKLWAWGGIAGASKGIEDMQVEVAASIANTVAQAKGWTPPAK